MDSSKDVVMEDATAAQSDEADSDSDDFAESSNPATDGQQSQDISETSTSTAEAEETEIDAVLKMLMGYANKSYDQLSIASENDVSLALDSRSKPEYQEMCAKIDEMLENWIKEPTYKLDTSDEHDSSRLKADRFKYFSTVGNVAWLKHAGYEWWPAVIKATSDKNVNSASRISFMFLEPIYLHFLDYKRKAISKRVGNFEVMIPYIPMKDNPAGRPEEHIQRSHHSWAMCRSYSDHTFFEISERMAYVYLKNHEKMVVDGKINLDLLAGLYYLAEIVWSKMTGRPVVHPSNPPDISEFENDLSDLEDVSYWREEIQERTKTLRGHDHTIDESEEGFYGYDFIQICIRERDPTKIEYSEESQQIVEERNRFAKQLLAIIKSPDCKKFLRSLRDLPATPRTKAWASRQMWTLINQDIASPSGPIVDNDQIFELYRLMRFLRRENDTNSVQFMRDCYDVWLPEAMIYAIQKAKCLSYEDAENLYKEGPQFTTEELAAGWDKTARVSMFDAISQR